MTAKKQKTTFVFCAPLLRTGESNGILSIVTLAKTLESLGCEVYFFSVVTEYPQPESLLTIDLENNLERRFWKAYHRAVLKETERLGIRLLIDPNDLVVRDAIVVYPDRTIGNPLRAKKVIRYFGNRDGVLNGGRTVDVGPHDFILSHSRMLHPKPDFTLFFSHVNPVFNQNNALNFNDRKRSLTYVGKGNIYGEVRLMTGTEILTRSTPNTKEELATLLKQTRFLFTWDGWSNIVSEALFCGAIPVMLRFEPFTESEIDASELGPLPRISLEKIGLLPGSNSLELISPDDLIRFERKRREFMGRVQKYTMDYPKQVGKLLRRVVEHFQQQRIPTDAPAYVSAPPTVEQALELISRGELPIIDLFTVAQRQDVANQPALAVKLYRSWLECNKSLELFLPHVHYRLGILLAIAQDYGQAEREFRAALAQNKRLKQCAASLAELLELMGRQQEAVAVWQGLLPVQKSVTGAIEDKEIHLRALNGLMRLRMHSAGPSGTPAVLT